MDDQIRGKRNGVWPVVGLRACLWAGVVGASISRYRLYWVQVGECLFGGELVERLGGLGRGMPWNSVGGR